MAAKTKKRAKRLRRWRERLEEVEKQLLSAHLDRMVWQKVRDGVLAQHPDADAHFIASYSRAYVVSQVARVEILATESNDPRSIPDLIRSIRKNPELLSRDRWVQMVEDDPDTLVSDPEATYDMQFGDKNGDLAPNVLRSDLKALKKLTDRLPEWAEQVTEHLDGRPSYRFRATDLRLRYDELDEALDTIDAASRRLQFLLNGARIKSWDISVPDEWQEPLRTSLFPFEEMPFLLPSSGEFS